MAYKKGDVFPPQFEDVNGDPLALGTIEFYQWNTTTPQPIAFDMDGNTTAISVTLDLFGRPANGGDPVDLFYNDALTYKIIRKDASGTEISPVLGPYSSPISSADLADTANPDLGTSLIGWIRAAAGAVATTLKNWMNWQEVNVWEFCTLAQIADIQAGTALIDITAAINAADVAATAAKRRLKIPGGTYRVTALSLNAPHITGDGWTTTKIKGTTVADDVITLPTGGTLLENLEVTSSIAAGSRTGAGIRITDGVQVLCRNIVSNGHAYGFWNQAGGNEFEHCFGGLNRFDGIFLDGSVNAQNEIGIYMCQFNGNSRRGINGVGPGLGVRILHTTTYANTENQQYFSNGLNDCWITVPESGGGAGACLYIDTGCSDFQITNPFFESTTGNANVVIKSPLVSLIGGFIQGCTNASFGGILIDHSDVSVSGVQISGNAGYGIRLGTLADRTTLSSIGINNTAATGFTTTTGIVIDGAGIVDMSAVEMGGIATKISGTIPAGSKIRGCGGVNDFNTIISDIFGIARVPVTLVNGLNSNIAAGNAGFIEITGPSGVFSLGGFAAGADGRTLRAYNTASVAMTIVNEDGSSTAANRISTLTGGNVTLRAGTSFASFIYSTTINRWVLTSTN